MKIKSTIKFFCLLLLFVFNIVLYSQTQDSVKNIIKINSDPPGAEIYLSNFQLGKTPFILKNQTAGRFDFEIILDEQDTFKTVIDYAGGEIEIYPVFNSDYTLFEIITNPENAFVFLNDTLIGETPIYDFKVPLGYNEIKIEKADYLTIQRKFIFPQKKVKWNYILKYKYGFIKTNDDGLDIALKVNDLAIPQNENQRFNAIVGESNFEAIWKNKRTVSKKFTIESETHYELSYKADYFNPSFLIKSALLPGLGQYQDNSKISGIIYFLTSATFGFLHINEMTNYNNYLDKYNADKGNYNEALNEVQTIELRNIMEQSLDDVNSSVKKKNIFLGCFIGVYLINVIDALIFHTEGFDMDLIEVSNDNLGSNLPSIKFNYPIN